MKRFVALLLLVLFAELQLAPVLACAQYSANAVYTFDSHPDLPLDKFAKGQLQLLQKNFARSYLVVAYRYINNAPLTAQEQNSLDALWEWRLRYAIFDWPEDESDVAMHKWIAARKTVPGATKLDEVKLYRSVALTEENRFDTYLNCPADAFLKASKTLADRIRKYGNSSATVKGWLKSQDLVFCHCGTPDYDYKKKIFAREPGFPEPAPADADALTKADRDYQIAAAHFYAQQFDLAKQEFEQISKDSNSPYQALAPYLMARCDLRKATVTNTTDTALIARAQAQLLQLSHDAAEHVKELAASLLGYTEAKLDPMARLKSLAAQLLAPSENGKVFGEDLSDFTSILDRYLETDPYADDQPSKREIASIAPAGRSDLLDWIVCMQGKAPATQQLATDKWHETHSDLWLLPCLTNATPKSSDCDELIKAAQAVPSTSPAAITAKYHLTRLLVEQKKLLAARTEADKILAGSLSPSTRNAFLSLRSKTAKSFDQFWPDVQQVSAAANWNYTNGPRDTPDVHKINSATAYFQGPVRFTVDGANTLNGSVPISLLATAAKSPKLDKNVKLDYVQACFTRASMLGDWKTANEMASVLSSIYPRSAKQLSTFRASANLDEKRFIMTCIVLQNPAMRPYISAAEIRFTAFDRLDSYHDNWWCKGGVSDYEASYADKPKLQLTQPTSFLTAAQTSTAKSEYDKLCALGPASDYLLKQVISWSDKHRTDPRLAEAFARGIKSSQFTCASAQIGSLSRKAFVLLHKNFPNDPNAKKTKVWYDN